MNPWAMVAMVVAYGTLVGVLDGKLRDLPSAVRTLIRKEREQDGVRQLDAMKEAVAARAGQAVIAIQSYQEQLAHSLRAQIADAETRARIVERRAADTTTALEAASTLVRELRAALDSAAALSRELAAQLRAAPPRPPRSTTVPPSAPPPALPTDADDTERKTTEMPSPPPTASGVPRVDGDDGGFGDDEQTKVTDRPAALAMLARPRLIPLPRGSTKPRSPTLLPPAPGCDEAPR